MTRYADGGSGSGDVPIPSTRRGRCARSARRPPRLRSGNSLPPSSLLPNRLPLILSRFITSLSPSLTPPFRLVLPDFRGHGQSPRPHDLPAYPPDVLADDALALIRHLGLGAGEYDLGGYSLGGRIVVRMLARGAEPGRAVVAGQGLAKIAGPQGGGANRRALTALADGIALPPDSADAQIAHWAAELGADPRALLCVLGSLVPTPEDDLRRITTPTLVVIGDRDERSDAGELAALLAALLPAGRFARVPGGHGARSQRLSSPR